MVILTVWAHWTISRRHRIVGGDVEASTVDSGRLRARKKGGTVGIIPTTPACLPRVPIQGIQLRQTTTEEEESDSTTLPPQNKEVLRGKKGVAALTWQENYQPVKVGRCTTADTGRCLWPPGPCLGAREAVHLSSISPHATGSTGRPTEPYRESPGYVPDTSILDGYDMYREAGTKP